MEAEFTILLDPQVRKLAFKKQIKRCKKASEFTWKNVISILFPTEKVTE